VRGRLTPLRAIRKFCLECAGSSREVELCTAGPKQPGDGGDYGGCPLYDFRQGHNPAHRGHAGGFGKRKTGAKSGGFIDSGAETRSGL
jgi:hypothetical protein